MASKTRDIFNVSPDRPVKNVAVQLTDTHFYLDITYADGEHETRWRAYDLNKGQPPMNKMPLTIPVTKEKVVGFTIKIHEASPFTPTWQSASAEIKDSTYLRAYIRAKRFALLLADPIYEVSKWEYDPERPDEYVELATCNLGGKPLPQTEKQFNLAVQGDFTWLKDLPHASRNCSNCLYSTPEKDANGISIVRCRLFDYSATEDAARSQNCTSYKKNNR